MACISTLPAFVVPPSGGLGIYTPDRVNAELQTGDAPIQIVSNEFHFLPSRFPHKLAANLCPDSLMKLSR
jgi:hypothetical protein